MTVQVGSRLRSRVCSTEVVVVRTASEAVLECGGAPMEPIGSADGAIAGPPAPALAAGTQLGKRYVSESSGLEVMCTKPGDGTLSVGGVPLVLQQSKALPSSD